MNEEDRKKVYVKEMNCPHCSKQLNSAVCEDGSDERPNKGDYSICCECLEFLKFDKNLKLVKVNLKKISSKNKRELLAAKEKLILAKKWYSELN